MLVESLPRGSPREWRRSLGKLEDFSDGRGQAGRSRRDRVSSRRGSRGPPQVRQQLIHARGRSVLVWESPSAASWSDGAGCLLTGGRRWRRRWAWLEGSGVRPLSRHANPTSCVLCKSKPVVADAANKHGPLHRLPRRANPS